MKITPLPSVEKIVEDLTRLAWLHNQIIEGKTPEEILTQDRNQAYTSLVEGIEGLKIKEYRLDERGSVLGEKQFVWNQCLKDIIENVVKPLYGKE